MPAPFIDRIEKTREQIKNWSTERLDEVQARQKELIEQGEERLQAGRKVLAERKDALTERTDALRKQADEALDHSVGALRTAEATVLEAARDLLARGADTLGDRAPFLARGEKALEEALVALRAGHKATLPIEGYTEGTVKDLLPKIEALDLAGLRTVRAWEAAHKNRKTVLRAIDKHVEALTNDEA